MTSASDSGNVLWDPGPSLSADDLTGFGIGGMWRSTVDTAWSGEIVRRVVAHAVKAAQADALRQAADAIAASQNPFALIDKPSTICLWLHNRAGEIEKGEG